MTRTTRKTVCAITFISFVVAVFAALCFATKGFTVWDANKWFNYWGHGEPVTVAPDAQAEEQQSARIVAASYSGIVHDSDDAMATVSVQQLSAPTFEYTADGVYVLSGNYPPIGSVTYVTVYHGYGIYLLQGNSFSFVHTSGGISNHRHYIPFDSLKPYLDGVSDFGDAIPGVKLCAQDLSAGTAGYTDSYTVYSDVIVFPTVDVVPELNGTIVTVNSFMPADPYFTTDEVANNTYVGYSVHVKGDGVCDCYPTGFACDCGNTYNAALGTIDGNTLAIDLTQLSFVDNLGNYTVEFIPHYSASRENQAAVVFYVVLDIPTVSFSISRLPSPTNIAFADGKLTWTAVDGSDGYYVGITANGNDHDIIVETNEADVSDIIRQTGDYMVRVRALGNVGKALAASAREVNAFNAGNTITRMTLLTFDVDGDTVSKFVPYGGEIADYLYDVELDGKQFSGWYYDTGFSRAVTQTDKITGDVTIYARLTVLDTQAASTSWWVANKKQFILWSCVSVGALVAIGVIAAIAVKRKGK